MKPTGHHPSSADPFTGPGPARDAPARSALAPGRGWPRADVAAVTALALLALLMLLLAAAPVYTDDLWWHLAAGEHYLREGLWPAHDPLLHTGLESGPVQHEWLFGVLVHLTERGLGFHGLRLLHALAVGAAIWALWRLMRAHGHERAEAAAIVAAFIVLAWFRLAQLRPDLASILATIAVVGLVLHPAAAQPTLRARLAVVALFVPWANIHSLFLVGTNLMIAALLGLAMHAAIARALLDPRRRRAEVAACARRARVLLPVLAGATLAAAINPRGFAHHLTFLTSSAQTAIWHVTDEWSHFVPFVPDANDPTVGWLRFLAMNVVIALFLAAASVRAWRVWRERSRRALGDFDCVGFGLGLAALVAIIVSIRFMWLGFLPLAYVLRGARGASMRRPARAWALAFACAVLMIGFANSYGVQNLLARYGPAPRDYVSLGYASHKYHAEAVHFLRESGLEGRLFNDYELGGFFGYWLAPALRTFVDGRAEHYGYDVYTDYSSIMRMRLTVADEDFTDVLDRRGVDVFVGVGFPGWWRGRDTTQYLRGFPGWLLVSRSYRHAIYLRQHPSSDANLMRVERYYAREGVPFDPQRGFDPARVIRERPQWAAAHAMTPRGFERLSDDDRAIVLTLNGAYDEQVALDRIRIEADPAAGAARRRLVYGLLRLDRADEALKAARELHAAASPSAETARVLRLVKRYKVIRGDSAVPPPDTRARLNRLLRHASPLNAGDTWPLEFLMRTEGYPLRRVAGASREQ